MGACDAGVNVCRHSPPNVTLGFLKGGLDGFFDLVDVLDPAFLHPLGGHNTGTQDF